MNTNNITKDIEPMQNDYKKKCCYKTKKCCIWILLIALIMIPMLLAVKFKNNQYSNFISTNGSAEMVIKSNSIIAPIRLVVLNNSIENAQHSLNKKADIIKNFFIKNEIPENEIYVTPPSVYDKKIDNYDNRNERFRLEAMVIVKSQHANKVEKILSKLHQVSEHGVEFTVNNMFHIDYQPGIITNLEKDLVKKAMISAKAKADAIANISGLKIIGVRNAIYNGALVTESTKSTPSRYKTIRVDVNVDYKTKKLRANHL
ncbi:conserved hypothetical protein [Candidatus Xenohaliotis californiensis]|uniref:Oxidative stress defense protein n=1 Tax=Candidatus Xenohaliotis californiensis TaxID=84677 RepID=A0ABP0ERQ4_9RICK|nr:conserved hypothetical protein [Candidatus Xenohaliotis californiensis]